jgi:hypothetical protein
LDLASRAHAAAISPLIYGRLKFHQSEDFTAIELLSGFSFLHFLTASHVLRLPLYVHDQQLKLDFPNRRLPTRRALSAEPGCGPRQLRVRIKCSFGLEELRITTLATVLVESDERRVSRQGFIILEFSCPVIFVANVIAPNHFDLLKDRMLLNTENKRPLHCFTREAMS